MDNRTVQFTLNGHAEWRGGIAQGENNHILDTNLPVECGINRALIRSTSTAGKVTLTAQAKGLPTATLALETVPVKVTGGLSTYLPQSTLKGRLIEEKHLLPLLTKTAKRAYESFRQKPVPTIMMLKKATMISN